MEGIRMRVIRRVTRPGPERDYSLPVVDTDGDQLLDSAQVRAVHLKSAWEQAIVIRISSVRRV